MITKVSSEGISNSGIPFTFEAIIGSMFKKPDEKLLRSAARQCCKRGGMPGNCTCCDEIVRSSAWIDWPEKILEFLARLALRYKKKLFWFEKKNAELKAQQLTAQAA